MPFFLPSFKTQVPTSSEYELSYLDIQLFEAASALSQRGSSFLHNTVGFNKSAAQRVFFQSRSCQALLMALLARPFVHSPSFSSIFLRSGLPGGSLNAQGGPAPHGSPSIHFPKNN
jgi:hypothetical protein